MVCELDLGFCHFDIEQAFVKSDLEENGYIYFASGLVAVECRGR